MHLFYLEKLQTKNYDVGSRDPVDQHAQLQLHWHLITNRAVEEIRAHQFYSLEVTQVLLVSIKQMSAYGEEQVVEGFSGLVRSPVPCLT